MKKILVCKKNKLNTNDICHHCKFTTDSNKIVLKVDDEQAKFEKIYICDNVICTMSLGFLKENLLNLIEPVEMISKTKVDAVSRLGFDAINKIFLIYDKPVWNEKFENAEGFYLVWVPEDGTQNYLVENLNHHSSNKLWYENISAFEVALGNENVLIGWISGNEEYEMLDDSVIKAECTKLLRNFMNNPDMPEPLSVLRLVYKLFHHSYCLKVILIFLFRSNWKTNTNFRGSYSHFPLNSTPYDIANIAEPIQLNNVCSFY